VEFLPLAGERRAVQVGEAAMRKWFKKVGVLGGCLLGLGGLSNAAHAQFGFGPPPGGGIFADNPHPPTPPDFPNAGHPGSEPCSPFSMKDEGSPNAFACTEVPPASYCYHMAIRAEYLAWWVSRINVPSPLVTATSANPPTATDFGALGQPSTVGLYGPDSRAYGMLSGGRATFALAPGFVPPIEVSGLWINRNLTLFNQISGGDISLVRPVQLLTAGTILGAPSDSAYPVAGPGVGAGAIDITSRLNVWGIDTDMFWNLTDNGCIQFDLITGYKYLELNERFTIAEVTSTATFNAVAPAPLPPGLNASIVDDFFARNQFNGGTIGLRGRLNFAPFMLMADAKLSMGSTYQYLAISGTSTLVGAGAANVQPGGILALNSNNGLQSHHDFSLIPELNVTLSYQVTPNFRIFGGYNLLYWTHVLRAAEQIQTGIDPRQVPIDPAYMPGFVGTGPAAPFRTSNFFANGFTAGLEFAY
jgi:hypothetical protein